MKILLVIQKYNLNIEPDYNYTIPIGLAYISSVLKQAKYNVECLNMNHIKGTPEDILNKKLDKKKYDIICIGGMALDYPIIEIILNTIKMHKSNPISILGGSIITTEPELIFNSLKPDFGVIDEGEETILELVNAISKKEELSNIKGIIFSKNNNIIITPKRENNNNLDNLPFPDYEGIGFKEQLENMHTNDSIFSTFNNSSKVYPILASRSCPFQCTFCYHPGKYRVRSIKNVMDEIRFAVKKYKISFLLIYDDCFSSNKQRLSEFCDELKKLRKEISWNLLWMCQLIVNTVDENILLMMKKAGCSIISYGFESYSPIVLKSMKKYITPTQIDFAFKTTLKCKIAIQANFIFGDISETEKTANTTLNYWKNNCEGQVSLTLIQPYPGSQIYNHCIKKGLIKDKIKFIKDDIKTFSINMTDNMSEKEFFNLKKRIYYFRRKYLIYVIPTSKKKVNKNYSINVKCPFCKKKNEYSDCNITNTLNYGFDAICRNCFKRYYVASLSQYIILKKINFIIPYYLSIKNFFRLLSIKKIFI